MTTAAIATEITHLWADPNSAVPPYKHDVAEKLFLLIYCDSFFFQR